MFVNYRLEISGLYATEEESNSEGEGRAGHKKRKVYFSRLYRKCADMTKEELRAQIVVLVNAIYTL